MSPNKAWLRALEATAALSADGSAALPVRLDALAELWGDKPALLSDSETLSYAGLAERARAYTRWALAQGLGPGAVVGLLMPNRPDYLALWLGVSRTGAVVALLNANATGAALVHAIAAAAARTVIVASELALVLESALAGSADPPTVWVRGEGAGGLRLSPDDYDRSPLGEREPPGMDLRRTALNIYTSGTTGLPKAARVSHHRVLMWSGWFSGMMGATPEDRLYNCLPMYHSVGGVVATGAMLLTGGSVVIAEKFSASRFWPEVAARDCSIFQYIGELCRYLVAAPPHPDERSHRLRLACGNGLREQVWLAFQERFAVPQILEFYAATEGTFSLYNAEGRPGAVGRVPAFLAHRFPAAVIRLGEDGQPVREVDGLCRRCGVDEPGEAIGRIAQPGEAGANRFEGYTDPEASERKVLRDVFSQGDAWMRTGDLMRIDAQGFYRFVDRLGDTFRWKGENVSTAEVAETITACPGVVGAAVYGVEVPGAEGRAGMATVQTGPEFDLAVLAAHLATALPAYARPVFLRLSADLDATETFKVKKGGLAMEGYDPAVVGDPLYLFEGGEYRPLAPALHARLQAGELRL